MLQDVLFELAFLTILLLIGWLSHREKPVLLNEPLVATLNINFPRSRLIQGN
jgi:hypothetical protein